MPISSKKIKHMAQNKTNDKLTDKAIDYIEELFRSNSDGHGMDHTLRVWHNALAIAKAEGNCDMEIISLAALLHDVDDHKLFHTENNANARCFLQKENIDPEKIETICAIINSVSFSKNRGKRPDSIEGRIVQDADRLDAIGAIGIARTFLYSGGHGRSIEDSVGHFHEKLLLLKDEMNTQTAKEMAVSRHAYMEGFLEELSEEMKS